MNNPDYRSDQGAPPSVDSSRPRASGFRRLSPRNLRNLHTFDSLSYPAYRFYFFGMVGQWGSMNMQMVTRSLLIYRLTDSAAILGIMSLANAVPMLLLALFGGALADRIRKKAILQVGLAVSGLISLAVALSLSSGYLSAAHAGSWWVLIATSVLQGSVMALMNPSRQAIIPEIVNQEQVMNAMALNGLGMNTLRLLAPALAGFLVDAFDFEAVYYAMTGLYLMGFFFTCFLPRGTSGTASADAPSHGAIADIKEGIRYIRGETTILIILVVVLLTVLLSMPYQMLMPIFTDDILKVGATGMGILMAISGAGAMVGSLVIASMPNRKRGLLLLSSSLLMGLALAAFALSRSMALSLGLMVFVGIGQAGRMTLSGTLLQSYAKPEYLGRVMSIYMLNFGISSFGTFAAGVLAQTFSAPLVIATFAVILAGGSILSIAFLRRISKLE